MEEVLSGIDVGREMVRWFTWTEKTLQRVVEREGAISEFCF